MFSTSSQIFGAVVLGLLGLTAYGEISPFIIGGQVVTDPSQFPFFVRIFSANGFLCGGTLISSTQVLSAAHCFVHHTETDESYILAGCLQNNSPLINQDNCCKYSFIKSIRIHGAFNTLTYYSNDIAVLTLETPLPFSSTIETIPLIYPIKKFIYKLNECMIMGWGCTKLDGPPPYENCTSSNLNVLNVTIQDMDNCKRLQTTTDKGKQICAGNRINGGSPCLKDSGGPLICEATIKGYKFLLQVGIISYGPQNCNGTASPAVFTSVGAYRHWIKNESSSHYEGMLVMISLFVATVVFLI